MRLRWQFAWLSTGRVLTAGVQAVTIALVARHSSLAEMALLTSLLGITMVVQAAGDFGLGGLLIRTSAASTNPAFARAVATAADLSSVLIAAGYGAVMAVLAATTSVPAWAVLLAVMAGAEKNMIVRLGVSTAHGRADQAAQVFFLRRVLTFVVFGIAVATGSATMATYVVADAVAVTVGWVAALRFSTVFLGPRTEVTRKAMTLALAEGRPFWVNTLSAQLRNLDAAIASGVAGTAAGAYYGLTSRLLGPLRLLPDALAGVLMPAVARPGGTSPRRAVRIMWLVSAASVAGYGVAALVTPWVVPWLLGPQYEPAVLTLQIAMLGLPLATCSQLCGAILQGAGHPRPVATAALVGSLLCLSGVAAGAAMGGAPGAALGLGFSYVIQATLLLTSIRRTQITR